MACSWYSVAGCTVFILVVVIVMLVMALAVAMALTVALGKRRNVASVTWP